MQEHTAIPFPLPQLTAADPLTEVLRQGAQRLLAQAIEAEVAMLLARYAHRRDPKASTPPKHRTRSVEKVRQQYPKGSGFCPSRGDNKKLTLVRDLLE